MSRENMTEWIQKQYNDIENSLKQTGDFDLVKLVSEYRSYDSVASYIASILKTELSRYTNDLRFGRWLKLKEETSQKKRG